MKKYMDIPRLGHKTTQGMVQEGDRVVYYEKIDGSNASFKRDGNAFNVLAFSRNNPLDEQNNLGGYYNWVQDTIPANKLLDGVIYFGEWTNPHKVRYAPENTRQFFLFDVYNEFLEEYMDYTAVVKEAQRLGLRLAPILYEGEYKGFDHLMTFVGQTKLGGKLGDIETGEGVVVKRAEYKDRFGNQVFAKVVVDAFREVQSQKPARDPNQPESLEAQWVTTNLTKARVDKMLYKLVDEGVLDAEFGIEDMGTILKNINKRLIDDMLKEESEYLPEEFSPSEIGKSVSRKTPAVIKEIIQERSRTSIK